MVEIPVTSETKSEPVRDGARGRTHESTQNKRNPEGTRRRILKAATEEFRLGGLAGARVDCIARRAETNERMLYYYFGSKEKLFIAALEATYEAFVAAQTTLELDHLPPDRALIVYAKNIWEYLRDAPELVRLINNENLHQAAHLKQFSVRESFHPVIDQLAQILRRGAAAGVFRHDIEPVRLYLSISALGFYVISNRYTLQQTFGCDFADDIEHPQVVRQHTDMLLAYVRPSVFPSC